MLSTVVALAAVSVAAGFSIKPMSSRATMNIKMAADPWFPGTTGSSVDINSLE